MWNFLVHQQSHTNTCVLTPTNVGTPLILIHSKDFISNEENMVLCFEFKAFGLEASL